MSALAVDVLGTAVVVRAPEHLLAALRAALIDLPPGSGRVRQVVLAEHHDGFTLHDGERLVRAAIAPSVAVATLVWHLNAIATTTAPQVLVHAGCVAEESGGAVLLPGRSGAGKSTLTAACVAAGLSYLSDELAALDPATGMILPYPKPIGLAGEQLVAASSLGGGPVAPPTAPTAIVFPRFEPGGTLARVSLDPGWTLVALASHAPNLATLDGTGLAWLGGLAVACPAIQVTHGDAREVTGLVRELAGRRAVPLAPAPVLAPVTAATTTVAVGTDVAVLDHRTGQVHLLNSSAAAVWCAARGASPGDDRTARFAAVSEELEQSGGSPASHDEIAATLDQLVRAGLLPRPIG